MADETSIGGGDGGFHSTHWTLVFKARQSSPEERRAAMDRLIRAYWKPVYFLVRRRGHGVEAAKDFTQGFFAAFLERDFLRYVDQDRGKFRIFLRTALDHYLADEHDRATALKRGGGRRIASLDFDLAEAELGHPAAWSDDPDQLFRRKWAVAVMRLALERLREEYALGLRLPEFEVLRPFLTRDSDGAATYEEAGRTLGLSAGDVNNRLHRLRKLYRQAILDELRSSTATDEEAEEELRDLFAAVAPPAP
jgi:RNA polymerase sigma-70 factor (ECF subfamily)